MQTVKTALLSKVSKSGEIEVIAEQVEVPHADALKQLAYDLKAKMNNAFIVLGTVINEKPLVAVIIDEQLVKEKGLHAGNIVKEAAKEMRGGGGGQPHFATAGGSDPKGVDAAIAKALSFLTA